METQFDRWSKLLGSGLSRRTTLKLLGVSMTGAALSTLGLRTRLAEAADPCRDVACEACHAEDQCGVGNAGCSCITKWRNGAPRRCFCHQIISCAGLLTCNTNRDCKNQLGRGWKCAASCCGTGLCHPKCGVGPTETPGGGLTSAG